MNSWWTALRLARREVRRATGRTALTVAMVGLPVVALAFLAAMWDMYHLTPTERVERVLGAADGYLAWPAGAPGPENPILASEATGDFGVSSAPHTAAQLLALLPPGSRVIPVWHDPVVLRTPTGVDSVRSSGLDAGDPLARGIVRLDAGRLPRGGTEVALSPAAAAHLRATVGGTVRTTGAAVYTVVGLVEIGGDLGESALFPPDGGPAPAPTDGLSSGWLVGQRAPLTWAEIQRLSAYGILGQSHALALHPPAVPFVRGLGSAFDLAVPVVGLALLEVVLLAGPAFAIGARRRQRELALIAANGGSPAMLRRVVLADGVVCGVLAAGAGLAVGVGLAFAARGLVEDHFTHTRLGADRVYGWAVAGLVVLAVGTSLVSALVPAYAAGRQDVVAALAGRRGAVRSRRRWVAVGVAGAITGGLVAAYGTATSDGHIASGILLAGLLLAEVGLVLCTPSVVGLVARAGRFLPPATRIALRDTARRRASAAPAISAVMAAVAGGVAMTIYLNASAAQQPPYRPSLPVGSVVIAPAVGKDLPTVEEATAFPVRAVAAAVRTALPGAAVFPVSAYGCRPSRPGGGCQIQVDVPPDHVCPYPLTTGRLSLAGQRLALADPRCDLPDWTSSNASVPLLTDDPAVVAAATGLRGADLDRAASTLRAGGALVSDPTLVENGLVTIEELDFGPQPGRSPGDHTARVPGYVVTTGIDLSWPILGPRTAPGLPITVNAAAVLATPAAPISTAQRDALTEVAVSAGSIGSLYIEDGARDTGSALPPLVALAAGVVALGAAGVATGLAAADSRGDMTTLAAVGATPGIRRRLSLTRAGVISGLGAVLGALAGTGAAFAILTGMNAQFTRVWPPSPRYPLEVPWLTLAISLLAVPSVAMVGAGLLTRSRLPSERRTG